MDPSSDSHRRWISTANKNSKMFLTALNLDWLRRFDATHTVRVDFRQLDGTRKPFRLPFRLALLSESRLFLEQLRGSLSQETAETIAHTSSCYLKSLKSYWGVATRRSSEGRLFISEIDTGSPGDDSGLKTNDVLIKINNHSLHAASSNFLVDYISTRTPGTTIRVVIERTSVIHKKKPSETSSKSSVDTRDPLESKKTKLLEISVIVGSKSLSRQHLLDGCRKAIGWVMEEDLNPSFVLEGMPKAMEFTVKVDAGGVADSFLDFGALSPLGMVIFSAFLENLSIIEEMNFAYSELVVFDIIAMSAKEKKSKGVGLHIDRVKTKEERNKLQKLFLRMKERAEAGLMVSNGRCILEPPILLRILIISHALESHRCAVACLRYIRSTWPTFAPSTMWSSPILQKDRLEILQPTFGKTLSSISSILRLLPMHVPVMYVAPCRFSASLRSRLAKSVGEAMMTKEKGVDAKASPEAKTVFNLKHKPSNEAVNPPKRRSSHSQSPISRMTYNEYLDKRFGIMLPKEVTPFKPKR